MLLNARRLHDDDNNKNLIPLAIEEITERHRAQAELARQRTWLQTTLSSIGNAVMATHVEGHITFPNCNAERQTGWRNEQPIAS